MLVVVVVGVFVCKRLLCDPGWGVEYRGVSVWKEALSDQTRRE